MNFYHPSTISKCGREFTSSPCTCNISFSLFIPSLQVSYQLSARNVLCINNLGVIMFFMIIFQHMILRILKVFLRVRNRPCKFFGWFFDRLCMPLCLSMIFLVHSRNLGGKRPEIGDLASRMVSCAQPYFSWCLDPMSQPSAAPRSVSQSRLLSTVCLLDRMNYIHILLVAICWTYYE